jgi:DNA-binding MarR family transcriptional regulator
LAAAWARVGWIRVGIVAEIGLLWPYRFDESPLRAVERWPAIYFACEINRRPMSKPPRLIFLLNSAQRRLQQFIAAEQERAARAGEGAPSPAQSGVLFVLAREDGATMGRLAQALDLAPSAMSGLVQRMEAQHWVARRASELDARTQHVWLQPAGRALLPALHKALGRINESLAGSFSPSELQTVGRWLEHVQTLGDSDE